MVLAVPEHIFDAFAGIYDIYFPRTFSEKKASIDFRRLGG